MALRLLICFGVAAIASFALGQDANWDLRNYHIYNPYALLHGRLGIDLMPAGIQSTLNPLLDLPYYFLATGPLQTHPRAMAAVAGLPFGALLFVVLQLATWLLSPCERAGRYSPYIAAAIAGTAAATSAEIGTTFNDIPIAAMILGAFLIGARATEKERFWRLAAAGALTGAAIALKPTAMVFAPGELVALLALGASWKARVRVVIAFAAGAATAGLAIGAPWALLVMHRYGSPLFPLMNALFRSDWYPSTNLVDTRFLPCAVWQDVFYPFFSLRQQTLVTEIPERDARMALATLALVPLAASIWKRRTPQPRRVLALIVFAVVSYVPWMLEFSILRYAIVLEALAALLIMTGVNAATGWAAPKRRLAAPLMGCCVLGCLVLHTERPDWWRIPYGRLVLDIERVTLPPKSLVIVINEPMAIVLPSWIRRTSPPLD